MRIEDFDFELPESLIAQDPLSNREDSRLLVLPRYGGPIDHSHFSSVVDRFESGDLLVVNDTRVTARRLVGRRATGGTVEALILRRVGLTFEALTKPAKKLRLGTRVEFEPGLHAEVTEDLGEGLKRLKFDPEMDEATLSQAGTVPLPPYIRHGLADESRYQTMFASVPGSAAAPTAGLHFTPGILQALRRKGVGVATVTLDVGLDTFRPLASGSVDAHVMHGETCRVTEETARAIESCRGRIIAVGTTTVRTLETFAVGRRQVRSGETVSRLFITPGYDFQVVDGMFTNFHLPRTTMLLMVAALVGRDRLMAAYAEAVRERYRFLSFGDSMLIS